MFKFVSEINIPAYSSMNIGLLIKLKLTALENDLSTVECVGKVAIALKPNFMRIIEIMSALKKSWEILESYSYLLECQTHHFLVKESKSSSMALSIALLNVYRSTHGERPIKNVTGTGILRIDGSLESANGENEKYLAAIENVYQSHYFITSRDCAHLYELEDFLNKL